MIKINPTNQELTDIIQDHNLQLNTCHASRYSDLYNNFDKEYLLNVVYHIEGYKAVYVSENLFELINIKACIY